MLPGVTPVLPGISAAREWTEGASLVSEGVEGLPYWSKYGVKWSNRSGPAPDAPAWAAEGAPPLGSRLFWFATPFLFVAPAPPAAPTAGAGLSRDPPPSGACPPPPAAVG